ncbi:hypothetical protein PVAND_017705 [Polypedilum vanderplanki]|uniref:Uncharacterized protein n=1 Tax=Polypedilum vanderplanki TaxID=319348 RepID=A0A9J6B8C7_POLVA|nr:hypothetical protein PVAND_017705 [Polypedilum vanderplanki]
MKKFETIITLFLFTFVVNSLSLHKSTKNHNDLVSQAFVDVIHKFYIVNNIRFNFIIYGKPTHYIEDIINNVIKQLSENITVNIIEIKDISDWEHQLSQSAIILMKSLQDLEYFYLTTGTFEYFQDVPTKMTNYFPKNLKFLTFVEEVKNLKNLNDFVENLKIPYVSDLVDVRFYEFYIIAKDSCVEIIKKSIYSKDNCGNAVLEVYNSFDIKAQKWNKELVNFELFTNFHGCLLSFLVYYNDLLYTSIGNTCYDCPNAIIQEEFEKSIVEKNVSFYGLIPEIINLMAIKANFTPHFMLSRLGYDSESQEFKHYEIGTKNFEMKPSKSTELFASIINFNTKN